VLILVALQGCGLKWSLDNQYLASGGNDNRLYVWNLHSLQPVQTYSEHLDARYVSANGNNVTVRNLGKEFDVENEDSYHSNSNSNSSENLKSPTKVLDNEEQYRSQARQLTSVVTMWSSSYSTSPAKASQGKDVYSDRCIPFRQGNNWKTKFPMISVSTLKSLVDHFY
jgi:hypothetical protein